METQLIRNRAAGLFILRVTLGFIFLMQGWGKVFSWGVEGVYAGGFASFETTFLPVFLLKFAAYFTSYAELIGGLFLVLGVFRSYAYYALGAVLIIVSYGHGLQNPVWDLSDVAFRMMMLIPLLLLPVNWDTWSFDHLINKRRNME